MLRGLSSIALAFLVLLPGAAFAQCTASGPAPQFDVVLKDPPVNYDFSQDRAALAKIADQDGMAGLAKSQEPFGLTIGRYDLEVVAETDSDGSAGVYCARLRAAHVVIGLKQLDVLVDRRFADGTCERQAVLDHEAQHVAIFREAARYYLPAAEATLQATSVPQAVVVPSRDAARAVYLTPITAPLQPIFDAINGRARDGNTRLDTPETYADVFKSCSNW